MFEECLDLIEHPLRTLTDASDIRVEMGVDPGCDQPVIADPASIELSLLGLDHAEQSNVHHAADRCGLVDKQQDIEGIAILGACRGIKPEIVGKRASKRKDAFQPESTDFGS